MMTKITKKCDVCGATIETTEYGGVKCKNCGWIDDPHQRQYPACANANNLISLKRARELWRQHKRFLPTFDEMLSLIERGFDLSIRYKNISYHLVCYENGTVHIENEKQSYDISYKDIDDFTVNAKIDDKLLSEIWGEINKVEYAF
ncbi:MAG: hypothetical protein NC184_01555 [Roseburia sp.]|nr:hypothetical protein [Roseburia sp.]